jgi:hypothetical protein
VAGFSLHAGVAARAHEREKLERICRYVARPAVSEKRLSLLSSGHVRYELKTPYHDGSTHVIFEPLDFIARLVTLVPKPWVNLTRFHGVFAPNSAHRVKVAPAKWGKGNKAHTADAPEDTTPTERRAAMTFSHNLGQHRVESQIDDGLMTGRYLVLLRLRALMLPKLRWLEHVICR